MMIKEAIYATVFTLFALFALLCLANWLKRKKSCVVCGDPSREDFCSEGCENLHYDEEELHWEEMKVKAGYLDKEGP